MTAVKACPDKGGDTIYTQGANPMLTDEDITTIRGALLHCRPELSTNPASSEYQQKIDHALAALDELEEWKRGIPFEGERSED